MLIDSCAYLGIKIGRENEVKVITTTIVSLDQQIRLTLLIRGDITN